MIQGGTRRPFPRASLGAEMTVDARGLPARTESCADAVERLVLQRRDSLPKRCRCALLDLRGGGGHPKRPIMPGRQVADENAVAVLVCFSKMVSERVRLLEAVEKPPVD